MGEIHTSQISEGCSGSRTGDKLKSDRERVLVRVCMCVLRRLP